MTAQPRAASPAWRVETHDELASTQNRALAAAAAGDPGRLAIRAIRQTAGRGTHGRTWIAPPGNLSVSLLLRPDPRAAGLWSLRAGIALHAALAPHLPDPGALRLAWPNDLLLDGAKLAGILIDAGSAAAPPGLDWLVAGIGVNLAHAPALPDRRTTSLAAHGAALTQEALLAELLPAIDTWAEAPEDAVLEAWLARGPAPGHPHAYRIGSETIAGGFAGLDASGALRLTGVGFPILAGERLPQPG